MSARCASSGLNMATHAEMERCVHLCEAPDNSGRACLVHHELDVGQVVIFEAVYDNFCSLNTSMNPTLQKAECIAG